MFHRRNMSYFVLSPGLRSPLTGASSPPVASRPAPRRPRRVAFALAALAVLATVAPEQAAAQAIRTLISNTGQTSSSASNVVLGIGFTTGAGTYTLSSIRVDLRDQASSPTPEVRIYEDNSGNPGTLVATMINPGAITENAVNTYTAPPNTSLSASTAYWVVTRNSAGSTGTGLKVGTVVGSALDSGTVPGWSIGNGIFKNSDSDTSWRTSNIRIRFQVQGTIANTDPTVENPIPDQRAMAGTAFSYQFPDNTFADAEGDMLVYSAKQSDNPVLPTWLRFSAATRTFSGMPPAVETVSVKVTARDRYGGSANDEFDIVVVADSIPPSLTSAVVPADGNTIQLAFSEDLSANRPPVAAFTVTVGGSAVTVTGVAAGTTNDVLQITVSPLIGQSRAVVVAYDDPTVLDNFEAIQDIAGNDTPDFTTGAGGVPAVTNDSAIPNAAPDGWSLTPTGLAAGARFRLLFLSSTRRDGSSSDIADYNTFVQARAAAGHADIQAYSGAFRALGCTAAVDARDNTSTIGTGVPIYWLDGAKVADDYADFYDGSWDDEINDKNESGADAHDTSQSDNYPITGCKNDGTEEFAGATNPRGLGANTGFVRTGWLNSSGTLQDPIDGNDVAGTAATRPMYGLSAVFEVVSTTFISNTEQTSNSSSSNILATAFTTGASTYTLSSVGLHLVEQTGTPTPVVGIYGDSGGNPGTLLATMTNPGTLKINAVNTFTAPADTRLSSNTTYWVVTMEVTVNLSTGSTLDSGTAPGWSLGNSRFKTTSSATSWSTNALPILFQIRGKVRPENNPATGAPTITGTAEVRQTLTAVTTAIMDVDGLTNPGYTYQWIRVATDSTETNIGSATASTYTLVLDDVGTTIKVKVGFTDDASNPETLTSEATAAVAADTTPPTLTGADVEESNGLSIYLEFSEDLQLSNLPLTTAFTLTVDGSAATVSSVDAPGSALPQNQVWLILSTAIRQGQAVVVTYTDPTAGDDTAAIQDTAGTDVADFTTGMNGAPAVINNSTVATAVPDGWSLTPTGLAAGAKFRLLFLSSIKRDASSTAIADYNTFVQARAAAGHADIQAYSTGFTAVGCTADVDARDNTSTTYTNAAKGVPIYWLGGAKAADEYEDFYDGSWDDEANDKNESGNDGPDTSQRGNYPLTGCNHDGTEAFSGGTSRALGTSVVRLGRPNSSTAGDGPISNSSVNALPANLHPLYGLSALFQVPGVVLTNNPPVFSPPSVSRSVAENTAAGQDVGAAVTATDLDGHTLIYTLEGSDAASFGILSASGQIQTKAGVTYNHEAQSTYTVIVKADDSNGGTDTVTVTITVTDLNEPPGVPAAPSVAATAGSSTSLDVSWTAPTNTGPAIASYDLQYREGSSGNFTDGPQDETGLSAAIASLMANTSHQVQVRATNAEGDGDWSFAGTGRTGNTPPEFSGATAARSVAENTAAGQDVGAVLTATDADSDTLTYTLEGADAASFDIVTISAAAQIRTKAGVTYNHEAKPTHTVIVKADDGNGGADTVTVTITVTDVNEPPGVPSAPSVAATSGSTTSLDVTWTAPTNTGPAIASYDLQYREGASGTFIDGPQAVTLTSAAIASLAPGKSHQVQVRATNADGASDWSPSGTGQTSATVPGAPTGLVATASGSTQIDLTWTAPGSDGGSAITGYKIEVSPDGANWTTHLADTTDSATTYSHTGLSGGATRHYRVSAINTNGAGLPSGVDFATTGNNPPEFSAPTADRSVAENTVAGQDLGAALTATDADSDTLTYTLEGADAAFFDIVTISAAAQIRTKAGVTYNHEAKPTHTVIVKADDGNGGADTVTVTITVTDLNEPPGVPAAPSVMATAGSSTSLDVSWTAPTNTGPAIASYDLQYREGASGAFTAGPQDVPGTSAAIASLAPSASHEVQVRATNAEGDGDWSPSGPGQTGQTGGGGGGGGGGTPPPPPPPDPDPEPEPEPEPEPSGPPKAAVTVDAKCPDGLCRALTGVAVSFTDASTGAVRSRTWDFGDGTVSRRANPAFSWAEPGFYVVTLTVTDGSRESTVSMTFLVEAAEPAGTCVADATTRCLRDLRYSVTVDWQTADGSGQGRVVRAGTDDSRIFYFFDRNNWEVLIKVLDGCGLNENVWVFGASTTDLGYAIRVTDTATGTVKEYRNEPGMPAPAITDTKAFAEGCRPQ